MKKILLISGFVIVLFFSNAFKLFDSRDNLSALNYLKQNIISCDPDAGSSFTSHGASGEEIFTNDNRKAAGEMRNGVFYLKLETRVGNWYPETHDGDALNVYAFAEAGKSLQVPGPLIRVPEGTVINAEVHNTIPGSPLILHGFYSHPGNAKDSITIPYGDTYKVRFKVGEAGTYFYWASDGNLKSPDNGLPFINDSQLFGAFIVDPPNNKPDPLERIFMIGLWNDTTKGVYSNEHEELTLNGLTWPYTERLVYQKDVPVHWRIINASNQDHPMHLHGFYYKVNSRGNVDTDNIYKEKDRYLSVTELVKSHETMWMTWTPAREGNWLFHCHTLFHIMANSFLRKMPEMTEQQMNDITTHARDGMGGLIMGISVLPSTNEVNDIPGNNIKDRALTLEVKEKRNWHDTLTGDGFVLTEGNASTDVSASIPGPPIILEQGKPVAIKVINHLHEATTIHWHGLEIESYFDGVAGWGNRGKQLSPLVMAGDSFIAHLTPPRAGTFIYHTHMHNFQMFKGMYGPLIVTKAGEQYNSATNKIFLLGEGLDTSDFIMLNGKTNPDSMVLYRGINYRFRIINMTGVRTDLTVSVLLNGVPVDWRPLAKDGADLPVDLRFLKPALDQSVTVGQTRDFEFSAGSPGNYLFIVKDYQNLPVLTCTLQVKK